jgi:hypothetical protein
LSETKKSGQSTCYWWQFLPEERFWMEITDRRDIGADLKCPQLHEGGGTQQSYSLIRAIWPGDVVFHYSTRARAVIGASVAGGPLEEREIVWTPHGTVGKSKKQSRNSRPGWWLPLYAFTRTDEPLKLSDTQLPMEDAWVREWIEKKHTSVSGPIAAPFQRYSGKLRAAQGYLTKMPVDFVNRWRQLSMLAERLSSVQDTLNRLGEVCTPKNVVKAGILKFKEEGDYFAAIGGGIQRRSRDHERLVRQAAEYLSAHAATLTIQHPIDLLMTVPKQVIFEAKPVGERSAIFAIREAVGQLFEYRHFIGPKAGLLFILLDEDPGSALVEYVENVLGLGICWMFGDRLFGGASQRSSTLRLRCGDQSQRRPCVRWFAMSITLGVIVCRLRKVGTSEAVATGWSQRR